MARIVVYVILFLLSFFLVLLAPKIINTFTTPSAIPPPILIALVGIGLAIITSVMFYFFSKEYDLPKQFFIAASVYNFCIILVKFVVSPLSLYIVNQTKTFTTPPLWFSNVSGFFFIGIFVFTLYFLIFFLFYHHSKKKIPLTNSEKKLPLWLKILVAVLGLYLFGGTIFMLVWGGITYLSYIFTPWMGATMAILLLIAVIFASKSFKEVEERASLAKNFTIISSFFWVGVGLIAAYHILWVVYILSLISIWPLRIVTPK